jgi:hypothetical protein
MEPDERDISGHRFVPYDEVVEWGRLKKMDTKVYDK